MALEEELAHHKAAQRMLEHHFVGAQTGYNEMSFLLEATRAEHSEQFKALSDRQKRSSAAQGPNDKAFNSLQYALGEDQNFDCKTENIQGGERGTSQ